MYIIYCYNKNKVRNSTFVKQPRFHDDISRNVLSLPLKRVDTVKDRWIKEMSVLFRFTSTTIVTCMYYPLVVVFIFKRYSCIISFSIGSLYTSLCVRFLNNQCMTVMTNVFKNLCHFYFKNQTNILGNYIAQLTFW